jgi:hypothetical protein
MRAVVILALVAFAVASVPSRSSESRESRASRTSSLDWLNNIIKHEDRRIEERSFRAEREYRFLYNGQLATGIPGTSRQHAVTRIQAVVSLIFKTETQVLLKLTHVRFAKMNDEVPKPRELLPFDATEETTIHEELEKQLLLPILFKYNNGLISELVFDGEEKPWSANIKRGVLNMLQVNLKQHGRTDMNEETRLLNGVEAVQTPENDFFTCQERTLEGDCETYYTITQQPSTKYGSSEQVLNVTKTINFEKCRLRPDIRYNYRFGEQCNTCERKFEQDEKVLESSTVTRFNISGTIESFLIESVKVQSQYLFAPVNEQANIIATYVTQKLQLMQAGPIVSRIHEPSRVQQSDSHMIYTPDWDVKKERFFMEGDQQDFLGASPYAAIKNKADFIGQILRRLVSYTAEVQETNMEQEGPRQLSRLVKALRMCTEEDLVKVHQDFYETSSKIETQHHQKVKDILVDALALAATKNTIQHLMEKIKDRKVHPIKAGLAIKALVNSRVVSEKHIDMMLELCRHQVAQRSPFLRQSCYLTVGSMMNALCLDNEDKLAIEFKTPTQKLCPVQLKQKYVKMLVEMFEQSPTKYDKILTLKTLANAGIDMSVFELEKIIKNIGLGAPHQPIVRSQAIDALRQLRSVMPRKIQKILMPIYKNQLELPEVRMTAVAQIMQTQPERAVLDQIAQQLLTERSQQIVSFVYTMMRTFANSTNPCEKRVAEDLQLSMRHARAMPVWSMLSKSKYIHLAFYSQKYNAGVSLNLGTILTNDSFLPKELMAGIDTALGGQWHKNVFQFGAIQQNGEKLVERLLGHQGLLIEKTLEQLLTRGKRSSSSSASNEQDDVQPRSYLRQLYNKLGVSGRRSTHETPMAMLYMRFRDQDYAMLPLDVETMPETVKQLFQNDRFDVQQIERFLTQGYHMNLHIAAFVHESTRKIPTTLGMPLVLTKKMPTIASITGQIKATMQPTNSINRVNLQLNIRPKITSTNVIAIEAWTPILNNGLKIVEAVQINLPINTEIEVNTELQTPEVKLVIKPPTVKTHVLAIQSRPVSFTRVWPRELDVQYAEPEEKTVHADEWSRVKNYDEEFGKHAIGVQMRVQSQWHTTPSKALAGTPCGPFAGSNHVLITLTPGHEMPAEIIIKADGQWFSEAAEEGLRPELDKFYETDDEQAFFKSESDVEPKKRFTKFNEYAQSFRTKKAFEHALNVKMETRGSSVERKAHVSLKAQCGEEMRFCKWQMEVVRTPIPQRESQPWSLLVKGQTLYPKMPTSLRQLQQLTDDTLECSTKFEAEWGAGQKDKFVHVKIQAKRSDKQIRLQRRSVYESMYKRQQNSDVFSPVQQYDELLKASMLTDYKIKAVYNVGVQVRNITSKAFWLLQHVQMWNTDVAMVDVHNPSDHVYAHITVDPRTLQYVNVTVRMPHMNVSIVDMALPMPITVLNVRRTAGPVRSVQQLLRAVSGRFSQNKCVVSSQRVKTFDDVKYRAPLTTCYSVLAKDCASDEPKFAVLMKKLSKLSDGKKVKIVTQEKIIELIARQEQFASELDKPVQVKINGRDVDVDEEQTLSDHGIRQQGQYITVELPEVGVQVHFDGYAASIKVSEMYRNAQCGLCGHFDGEEGDEFRTADNQLVDDVRQFHRSFFHQDDECDIDDSIVNDEEQYKYRSFVWDRRDRSSELFRSQEDLYSREERSTERTSSSKQRSAEKSASSSSKQRSAEKSNSQEDSQQRNSRERSSSAERRTKTSSWENSAEAFEKRVQEPRKATKVIEQAHEICFSTKPIRQCPKNTYPMSSSEYKQVTFTCLPRSDPEAHSLQRIARSQNIVRLLEPMLAKTSFVQEVQIPVTCQPY